MSVDVWIEMGRATESTTMAGPGAEGSYTESHRGACPQSAIH